MHEVFIGQSIIMSMRPDEYEVTVPEKLNLNFLQICLLTYDLVIKTWQKLYPLANMNMNHSKNEY